MRAVRTSKKLVRRKGNNIENELISKGFVLKRIYDINPFGVEVIKVLMLDNNLGYDCSLYDITSKLVKICSSEKRELYQIENIQDIKKIFNHIVENKLLDKKVGE